MTHDVVGRVWRRVGLGASGLLGLLVSVALAWFENNMGDDPAVLVPELLRLPLR